MVLIWLGVRRTSNLEHLGQRQVLGRSAPFTGVDAEEGGEEGQWKETGVVSQAFLSPVCSQGALHDREDSENHQ